MAGTAIVEQIVGILVAGLTQLGSGLGTGINNFVQSLAFTGTGNDQTLSVYFVMICVFGGIALAVGLTTKIFNWLSNLGN